MTMGLYIEGESGHFVKSSLGMVQVENVSRYEGTLRRWREHPVALP